MSDVIDFTALWQVVVISLVAGVGIVAVFSMGLAIATPDPGLAPSASLVRRGAAGLCFAVCAAAVALAVWVMLAK